MAEQDDLDGVHVWTNGHPDAGYGRGPGDTQPLPPVTAPPATPRRRSRVPLVVAALLAAGLLGAGSTAVVTALMSHDRPAVGNNAPVNGAPGLRLGHGASGNGNQGAQGHRQHISGDNRQAGGDDGQDND